MSKGGKGARGCGKLASKSCGKVATTCQTLQTQMQTLIPTPRHHIPSPGKYRNKNKDEDSHSESPGFLATLGILKICIKKKLFGRQSRTFTLCLIKTPAIRRPAPPRTKDQGPWQPRKKKTNFLAVKATKRL